MQPFAEQTVLLILMSVMLDLIIGDPKWLPHPVILFGKIIRTTEKAWNKGSTKKLKGIILAAFLPFSVFIISLFLLKLLYAISYLLGTAIEIYLISTTIAIKGLRDAAMEVYHPLKSGDLSEARKKLGFIVGRDTDGLLSPEIVRGTVETVAENTVDAIISPLFFAIIGGAPLALAYRAVNTLDSMVGYKNERFKDFGFGSARLDDLMNLLPARICTVCMWLGSYFMKEMRRKYAISITRRDASKHPSPNSGWPESMAAGLLGVQLGGVNIYGKIVSERARLGDPLEPLSFIHIKKTILIMNGAWILFLTGYLILFGLGR
ncbi:MULTISPECIES: adenosylcobinamide-phosphate synthase CbiB [Metabacillus]|uniref:Adenosylcobinamide-phosphate synthase CbiB n=1 Tax=Metabacillus hrfriensis TaxID=3048891 RepID=A0ACD4RHX3_9BACI|nr:MULTISPECIES: adenosylcobinamide-phosphate synthase CbiB [Metabacillus]UAL54530.1 adenosylcobinamide-phosphate synthase CbiB [Metabacillus dongyingensis]USK30863.1 adenosylcobinamide-phosphate synthase CbiB [Bacillus sp. CMF21]WHZ60111.1 adenosylcobinamide-phosphate synthase CbiB [Metabacillus sp. CT-WN-B3]